MAVGHTPYYVEVYAFEELKQDEPSKRVAVFGSPVNRRVHPEHAYSQMALACSRAEMWTAVWEAMALISGAERPSGPRTSSTSARDTGSATRAAIWQQSEQRR